MTKLEELYVRAVKANYAAEAARKAEDDAWVSYREELKKNARK
tara:strand:- start:434 stop:562 length:129 start_codon:yes stop_codon:yes gene_type:complete